MKTTLSTHHPTAVYITQVPCCAFHQKHKQIANQLKPCCPADLKTTPRWMTDICYYIYLEEEALVKFLR